MPGTTGWEARAEGAPPRKKARSGTAAAPAAAAGPLNWPATLAALRSPRDVDACQTGKTGVAGHAGGGELQAARTLTLTPVLTRVYFFFSLLLQPSTR